MYTTHSVWRQLRDSDAQIHLSTVQSVSSSGSVRSSSEQTRMSRRYEQQLQGPGPTPFSGTGCCHLFTLRERTQYDNTTPHTIDLTVQHHITCIQPHLSH